MNHWSKGRVISAKALAGHVPGDQDPLLRLGDREQHEFVDLCEVGASSGSDDVVAWLGQAGRPSVTLA